MRIAPFVAAALLLLSAAHADEQASYVWPTGTVPGPAGSNSLGSLTANYYNPALRALASCSAGATAPANGPSSAPLPYQCWMDTSASPIIHLRYWDGSQWPVLATLDASSHAWTISMASPVRSVTGATDTIQDGDRAGLIDVKSASAVAQILPQAGAGGAFASGWHVAVRNAGTADVTITPTSSTIDSAASLVLRPGQWVAIRSDGSNYISTLLQQPANANLWALAGLSTAADKCAYWTGAGAAALMDCKSWVRSVIGAADAAAGRAAFGLAIGTDVQAYNTNLAALAGLTGAAGQLAYFSGPAALSLADTTSYGRSVLNTADAAALRALAGSVIGTNVQGWDADLDCYAALSGTGIVRRTGSGTCSNGTAVSNSELATMANNTVKGNVSGSSAAPSDLTRSQLTALINPMVGDSGSGGTAGLCPAPGPGDYAAGKYCDAGGFWSVPAGSGGGGGLSDTDRRNMLLDRIYQSKLFGAPRRVVNSWATGFKAATDADRGINAGASSNVDTSAAATSGYVKPSQTAPSQISQGTGTNIGMLTVNGGLAAAFDGNISQPTASSAVLPSAGPGPSYIGKNYSAAPQKIAQAKTWGSNDTGYMGGGLTSTLNLRAKNGSAPSSSSDGTLLGSVGPITDVDNANPQTISSNNSATAWDYVWIETVWSGSAQSVVAEVQFFNPGTINGMTLETASQTTDANVSNARVLLEFDNLGAPALNADLTAEVTCDGGTNWATAPLSVVTSYSQGGRKVVETADQACTAGTSFAARIKTANGKVVPIYGVSVTAR